jgi:hypothetical protein
MQFPDIPDKGLDCNYLIIYMVLNQFQENR